MNKEIYKKFMIEKIENNFSIYEEYFEFDKSPIDLSLKVLNSLNNIIFQNLNNLILENYLSSVVITSHLLEKFCKLVIVQSNVIGLNLLDDKFDEVIENAYGYDGKDLWLTIDKLKSLHLISSNEKKLLMDLKNDMRNIYLHSNTLKITKDYPNRIQAYHFNLKNPEAKPLRFDLNTKTSFLKNEQIELEAKKKAFSFFKKLYPIIVNVDKKLQEKHKDNTSS